ncbi:uncharacterized protein [Globicephala melas]|uniref:uncharacterized protein n=1 Tax=Globicephala melas TaxID=9731 RepID=UPI00293D88B0|nr:uncharacterized protein LOC132597645 [Globicephala melas]
MDRENESPGQNLTLGNDVLDVLSVQLTDDLKERSGLVYEKPTITPLDPAQPSRPTQDSHHRKGERQFRAAFLYTVGAPRMPRGAYSSHHAAQPSRPGRISAGEADAAGKLRVPWCMAIGSAVSLLPARATRGPGAIALVQPAALPGLRWFPDAGSGVRCPARPVEWASCSARSHRRTEPLLPPSALVGAPAEAGRPCHRRPEERSQECRSPRDSPPHPLPWPCRLGTDLRVHTDVAHVTHSLSVSGTLLQAGVSPEREQARFCLRRTQVLVRGHAK